MRPEWEPENIAETHIPTEQNEGVRNSVDEDIIVWALSQADIADVLCLEASGTQVSGQRTWEVGVN